MDVAQRAAQLRRRMLGVAEQHVSVLEGSPPVAFSQKRHQQGTITRQSHRCRGS